MGSLASTFSFEGLGTRWRIVAFDNVDDGWSPELRTSIKKIVRDFEKKYSRFDADSLIGQLNSLGGIKNSSEELISMLAYALECAEVTNDHFNIAVANRLSDIGYGADYSLKPKAVFRDIPPLKDVLSLSDSRIELREGAAIDLGGFGKGWLIDKVTDYLLEQGVESFLIDGGGDIRVESGPLRESRKILLDNPFTDGQAIGDISIRGGAVASSSPKHRQWPVAGSDLQLHHLINPKSEDTIEDVMAVFTHADDAVSADTASTCLFVSPQHLHQKIKNHFRVSYCLVLADGNYSKTADYAGELFARS